MSGIGGRSFETALKRLLRMTLNKGGGFSRRNTQQRHPEEDRQVRLEGSAVCLRQFPCPSRVNEPERAVKMACPPTKLAYDPTLGRDLEVVLRKMFASKIIEKLHMRNLFVLFLMFLGLVSSAHGSGSMSQQEAIRISSEMMSELERIHVRLMDLLETQDIVDRQPELTKISRELEKIQIPFLTALKLDDEVKSTENQAQRQKSYLRELWKCQKSVSKLARFSELIVQPEVRFRTPSLIQKIYFDFLSISEDCRYQLGKQPSPGLTTPAEVYQAYLEVMQRVLLEMKDLDDPSFLAETKSDPKEWFFFKEKMYWRLYAENSWDLQQLYAITFEMSLRSKDYRQQVQALSACQSMHGSYRQLVDKFALALAFDHQTLFTESSLNRLLTKFAECERELASQSAKGLSKSQ
ncbi:hypothetical protein [Roseibium sediminicola]|uniref:Uncharacterized protein n=1 Tax=Roseibium sediminicola TaxID=2933272 RepID=A0ABT0GXY8_9HYPH|nr:hypothetical protein [Roseibium sp. CAU 1639]MCK7614100.1 hypothetical protein [Roseibium sp. CAU 1639]